MHFPMVCGRTPQNMIEQCPRTYLLVYSPWARKVAGGLAYSITDTRCPCCVNGIKKQMVEVAIWRPAWQNPTSFLNVLFSFDYINCAVVDSRRWHPFRFLLEVLVRLLPVLLLLYVSDHVPAEFMKQFKISLGRLPKKHHARM